VRRQRKPEYRGGDKRGDVRAAAAQVETESKFRNQFLNMSSDTDLLSSKGGDTICSYLHRFKGWVTRRFQAMGKLNSTCTDSPTMMNPKLPYKPSEYKTLRATVPGCVRGMVYSIISNRHVLPAQRMAEALADVSFIARWLLLLLWLVPVVLVLLLLCTPAATAAAAAAAAARPVRVFFSEFVVVVVVNITGRAPAARNIASESFVPPASCPRCSGTS
jgi:hypothetical protein